MKRRMKGICSGCKYMTKAPVIDNSKGGKNDGDVKKLKYCTLYRNWSKQTAWNCKFNPDRPGP